MNFLSSKPSLDLNAIYNLNCYLISHFIFSHLPTDTQFGCRKGLNQDRRCPPQIITTCGAKEKPRRGCIPLKEWRRRLTRKAGGYSGNRTWTHQWPKVFLDIGPGRLQWNTMQTSWCPKSRACSGDSSLKLSTAQSLLPQTQLLGDTQHTSRIETKYGSSEEIEKSNCLY